MGCQSSLYRCEGKYFWQYRVGTIIDCELPIRVSLANHIVFLAYVADVTRLFFCVFSYSAVQRERHPQQRAQSLVDGMSYNQQFPGEDAGGPGSDPLTGRLEL